MSAKFIKPSHHLADPDAAAGKLIEIANARVRLSQREPDQADTYGNAARAGVDHQSTMRS